MRWEKIQIINKQGDDVMAQSPIIISASRATDIPSFYSDWFMNRLYEGYFKWTNPFNGQTTYISTEKTRLFVFWTKNPKPMMKHLDYLDNNDKNYYFQYTMNDYDLEKLEPNVPNIEYRIENFIKLSEKIGKERVIWRFDPLILTDKISPNTLLKRIENIGNQLVGYTDKLVFSFADIKNYKKVQTNLRNVGINWVDFDENSVVEIAKGLNELNKNWGFDIATCAEKFQLEEYGISHNKCIDDDLIIKLFKHDEKLMDFLGVKLIDSIYSKDTIIKKTKSNKDTGQRELCGCIHSKDIGEYNTCPHGCVYCYANSSHKDAIQIWKKHKLDITTENIK